MGSRLALFALLVACGSKPPLAPPAIAHHAPAPAAATCGDVGVILRGAIENTDDRAQAGRAREAAIANACELDRWPKDVIDCVATKPKPSACLAKLSDEQRASYDDKLAAWGDKWGGSTYGGDDYGGVAGGVDAPDVECSEAVKNAGGFPPAVKLAGDDVTWDGAMRKHALERLCETDLWPNTARECMSTIQPDGVDACMAGIDGEARARITARLGEVDAVAGKLADVRKQPRKITCDKVVGAHYADARWKDKLDWVKGKDRTKMIAESRDRMKKACVADKWTETLRACITVGGGEDCFAAGSVSAWGFPAPGVAIATGIPECDAWGQAVTKLATCDKIPQTTRDALMEAYAQLAQQTAQMPKEALADMGAACKQATDAVKQIGAGCP